MFPKAAEVCGDGRVTDCDGAACRWRGDAGLADAAAAGIAPSLPT